ncbi:MAG TPA: tetratricopeptide repeat protein [Casimicrobiaceae bacterium]|nr:tetratricopeptide repeat protein [Casimicrobiaceae bacterium]
MTLLESRLAHAGAPLARSSTMLRYVRVLCVLLFAAGLPAFAQVPPELSEEARKQYNAGLKEAATLIKDKQFEAAESKLDALISQRPREPQARFLKGVVESDRGHAEAAMTIFRDLIADYPELPEPYNNLAVLYAQKGEYEQAKIALETAVRTAPDWAVARENLGDIYARLAAAEYERAAKLDRANKTAPAKLTMVRNLLAATPPAKPKS